MEIPEEKIDRDVSIVARRSAEENQRVLNLVVDSIHQGMGKENALLSDFYDSNKVIGYATDKIHEELTENETQD